MTIAKSTQLIGFAALLFLASCSTTGKGKPGEVLDEALRANRDAASLPAADEDYFHDMDGGISLPGTRRWAGTPGLSGPAGTMFFGTT